MVRRRCLEALRGPTLPLATQGESCRIHNAAVRALDKARIAWEEVFVGKGAAVVGAAATASLAVAVLARRIAPSGTLDVSTDSATGGHALQRAHVRPCAR